MATFPSIFIPIIGLDKFTPQMNRALKKVESVGNKLNTVGKKLTTHVSLPIIGAGIASIAFATNMNKSMADVATMIPNSTQRVIELKKNVQDLAIQTGKSTKDISSGLYQVLSAFGDSSETAGKLAVNTKAAVAGVSTVTDAINLTSAITKAYGDTSQKAIEKVTDLAFLTVRLGQTTFPELAESMTKVTSMADNLGISQEKLFSVMATATGVTGDATMVSTQLRSVMASLSKPTAQLSSLFEHLGYTSGKAMLTDLGLIGSLQTIITKAEQANVPLGHLLGRVEAQTLALALSNKLSDKYIENLEKMGNAAGAMNQAYKEQTKGINKVGFTMEQAKQRLIVLAQKFGDALLPVFEKILNILEPIVDWLSNLSPDTMKSIAAMGGLLTALGPVLAIAGLLTAKIAALSGAIASAGGVIALLSNPIGWVIGGIIALVGSLTILWGMTKAFGMSFAKVLTGMLIGINPVGAFIVWLISRFKRILPFIKLIGIAFLALGKLLLWVFWPVLKMFELFGKLVFGILDFALSTLEKLAGIALPYWLKKKIGLVNEIKGGGDSVPASYLASETMAVEQKQEFKGTLRIENAPPGTKFTIDEGDKNMDIDMGYVFAGAYN